MKKDNIIKFLVIYTVFTFFQATVFLHGETKLPEPVGYVNDFANVIPNHIANQITSICQEVQEKTGAQIAVVTVNTVGDEYYGDYAVKLFEEWGIGQKGKDNGVLLFQTVQERSFRIEVGYGLEGIIPDGLAGQIRDEYVFPNFKQDRFGEGHLAGVLAVASIIAKDAGVEITGQMPDAPVRQKQSEGISGSTFFKFLLLALVFLFFRGGRGGLLPLLLLGSLASGRRGGFSGGHGFGGGFGGFGGGMSGGGGAGGSY